MTRRITTQCDVILGRLVLNARRNYPPRSRQASARSIQTRKRKSRSHVLAELKSPRHAGTVRRRTRNAINANQTRSQCVNADSLSHKSRVGRIVHRSANVASQITKTRNRKRSSRMILSSRNQNTSRDDTSRHADRRTASKQRNRRQVRRQLRQILRG